MPPNKTVTPALRNGLTDKLGYSVEDLALGLSLSKGFVWNEIRRGALKARRFGRRVLVLHDDLQAYLKARKAA
jgi:excisionase family DNA binding protein